MHCSHGGSTASTALTAECIASYTFSVDKKRTGSKVFCAQVRDANKLGVAKQLHDSVPMSALAHHMCKNI